MSDVFSKDKRSSIMSAIHGRNTAPELKVRALIYKMGFRYRLHVRKLVGNPDIVLFRHRKIVFVNGCFWHGHKGCNRAKRPASNTEFWKRKIEGNIARDAKAKRTLKKQGWNVLTVWQCQTTNTETLTAKLLKFLTDGENERKRQIESIF